MIQLKLTFVVSFQVQTVPHHLDRKDYPIFREIIMRQRARRLNLILGDILFGRF